MTSPIPGRQTSSDESPASPASPSRVVALPHSRSIRNAEDLKPQGKLSKVGMGAAPTSPKTRLVLDPPWHTSTGNQLVTPLPQCSPTGLAPTLYRPGRLEPTSHHLQVSGPSWTGPSPVLASDSPPSRLRLSPLCSPGFSLLLCPFVIRPRARSPRSGEPHGPSNQRNRDMRPTAAPARPGSGEKRPGSCWVQLP